MRKNSKILFILLTAVFFLGSATMALAHMRQGPANPARMHYGQGSQFWGYGGPGCGMFGDLSNDQIQQLDEERTAFWQATKGLRQQIYQKRLELASELAKQNPDAAAAAAVQQQISDLTAQLDQKRLEHFLRVQKINPDAGRGAPMGFGMMGYGMRHHDMMGPGGGYGMGPAMMGPGGGYGMGPGMMVPGGSYGMGPGMMDRDYDRQYHDAQAAPAEKNTAVNKEN
jgi:Spy/CpxP family protein refolding chaperone